MRKMRDLDELTPEQMTCFIKPRWSEELYDIDADPQELKNLIGDTKYAANLAELRTALDGWQRETADAVPAVRPPDGYDRETGAPLGKKSGEKSGAGK
jgi:N-sulfoglucosamine sulfohydrolase